MEGSQSYYHTRLHLGFAAQLRILQVISFQMDLRSRMIMYHTSTRGITLHFEYTSWVYGWCLKVSRKCQESVAMVSLTSTLLTCQENIFSMLCIVQCPGWHKIFRFVGTSPPWPIFRLRQCDSRACWGFISFTSSCHKKSFSARKDNIQQKKNIFLHNKYILVTGIFSCHKKSFLVTGN